MEELASDKQFNPNLCVICITEDNRRLTKVKNGMSTLLKFSKLWKDNNVESYLTQQISANGQVLIHEACRRDYVNQRRFDSFKKDNKVDKVNTRRSIDQFDWKRKCFYCGKDAVVQKKHPDRTAIHLASTLPFREKVMNQCSLKLLKGENEWALTVKNRLLNCSDFVQAEARYHHNCHGKFYSNENDLNPKSVGRKVNDSSLEIFNELCDYIEMESECYSLKELREKMLEIAGPGNEDKVYSMTWLKKQLQTKYEDQLYFSEINGKSNVVCFRNMGNRIINDKWYQEKKNNIDDEAARVVKTAAKLIKAELRETIYNTDIYPSKTEINNFDNFTPSLLKILMETLITSELRQASISQSILKAARPRSIIPPLLFGLGVELDHVFGSRWLIDELYKLGFSVSYSEVSRYKQSVLKTQNLNELVNNSFPGTFIQWVGDNVDHNIRTLDGHDTFHGMGMIAIANSNIIKPKVLDQKIPRLTASSVNQEDLKDKGIPIIHYDFPDISGLRSIKFKPIAELLHHPYTPPVTLSTDLLWLTAYSFRSNLEARPNWSGFMQAISTGDHSQPSEITMLPIINLDPGNYSCIYSVLMWIVDQTKLLNNPTACITFDQPLWLKALDITIAKKLPVVCRLGGFHTLMSFLGSIGKLMAGSGLSSVLECVYGKNAVEHILSGKAISRAIRGHLLVDAALHMNLIDILYPAKDELNIQSRDVEKEKIAEEETLTTLKIALEQQREEDQEGKNEHLEQQHEKIVELGTKSSRDVIQKEIEELYGKVWNQHLNSDEVGDVAVMMKIYEDMQSIKNSLSCESRTSKLWILYSNYIETVRLYIRAERTSDWELHLHATGKMLNLFAATGHIHYAKSCRMYLQTMLELPITHPWLHEQLAIKKLFTVRRNKRHWAGLWTDLTIEQVLMRSIKSRGGMTRGRGMTEQTRILWIYSMHQCASLHNAMTTMTGAIHKTSEQHIEVGTARSTRDYNDLIKLYNWLCTNTPFKREQPQLFSLSTGHTSDGTDGVNCDDAERVGFQVQQGLDHVTMIDATIKRNLGIQTLQHLKKKIIVDKEQIYIDSDILFTRLIVLTERSEKMADYFNYELSPEPTSLFKDSMMRKPNKSTLATYLIDSYDKKKRRLDETEIDSIDACPPAKRICGIRETEESSNSTEELVKKTQQPINQNKHVIDGGALLHHVSWKSNTSYRAVISQYQSYLLTKYGRCTVIFDGYNSSTKDHEHDRRTKGGKGCADFVISGNILCHQNQHTFLSNTKNKVQFINMLSTYLISDGHVVIQCGDDADTSIVSNAIDFASLGHKVTVVADDTDIFVLLLYFWNSEMEGIVLKHEKRGIHGLGKLIDIAQIARDLDNTIRDNLLFIHAFTGCDTTSAIHGKGKQSIFKLVKQSEKVRRCCKIFKNENASRRQIGEAGVSVFIELYGGKPGDTLGRLRYSHFSKMASTSTKLAPEKLPPTEGTAIHHSWRVYLQVFFSIYFYTIAELIVF